MTSFSSDDLPHEVGTDRADWNAPLLITGCARSGTSALARLLSTHDRICIFNEYSLYSPPVLEESVWHRIREMRDDNPPPRKISENTASLKESFLRELPRPACDQTTRDWLFGRLQNPVQVYGDKMPYRYLEIMEETVHRFPGARFLMTLRDGRAVVASQIRQYRHAVESGVEPDRWMHATVHEAEYLWLRSVKKWLSLRANPPAPYLEVRYEEATQSPAVLARSICDFVGMEYREEEFQMFLESYQPVHADAWRDELPDIDAQLSGEFHDALNQLGYAQTRY